MKQIARTFAILVAGALWSGVLWAHHCIRDEYDEAKLADYTVVIEKISWVNPHVIFTGRAVQPDGSTAMWDFEASPPGVLERSDLAPDTVRAGDKLKIAAYRARSGARKGVVLRITLPDGRKIDDRFSWDGWCYAPGATSHR